MCGWLSLYIITTLYFYYYVHLLILQKDAVSQLFTEFQDDNRDIILAAAHINDAISGR